MRKPIVIGITGGIGGGKSVFSRQLRRRGQLVYDMDKEAKSLQNTDENLRKGIMEVFGRDIYTHSRLDRCRLAGIVFSDSDKLKILNSLVHPAVIDDFKRWVKLNASQKFLFMESAILYESSLESLVDKVVVITAPEDVRVERVMKRDGLSKESVYARIRNQMPESEKKSRADLVIDTSDKSCRIKRVDEFLARIESKSE